MKNDNPTTELVKLEAESDSTHALLCAVMTELNKQRDGKSNGRYIGELEEWKETISDAYFHDRRVADPTIEVAE